MPDLGAKGAAIRAARLIGFGVRQAGADLVPASKAASATRRCAGSDG